MVGSGIRESTVVFVEHILVIHSINDHIVS